MAYDQQSSPASLQGRARQILYDIESRTARQAARSLHGKHHAFSDHSSSQRHHAIIHARARGDRTPRPPRIQEIERFATAWSGLVPSEPRIRAAVAYELGREFRVPERLTPQIRSGLGLQDPDVRRAFAELYHAPLESIYARDVDIVHRARWMWSRLSQRLETLSPFWTAYALALTETVGASILALPIAVARIGPLGGIVVLALLGLVNLLTIAYMAEAVTRSGSIRYGTGFIGHVVGDYLGRTGTLVLTLSLFSICFLVLLAYYIGVARTMEQATRLPAALWALGMLLLGLAFLKRETLNATIAFSIIVGAINVALIVALSFFALSHSQAVNLATTPLLDGKPFDPTGLALVMGVALAAYFGHLSVSNCGRVVLRRDPSGRDLLWGNMAAQATAMLLYCLFVLAVNSAVPAEELVQESGTSLGPLAARLGPVVTVLGSVFVLLGMGMASIHFSLALFNLVRERLPVLPHDAHGHNPPFSYGRFLVEVSPVIAVFIVSELAIITRTISFSGVLDLVGVLVISLLGGIFPVLLLFSSRRKGDYVPGTLYRVLGNPLLLGAIYALFVLNLLLHGLVIWQNPIPRALAFLAAVLVILMTLRVARAGAFRPRTVVELREADGGTPGPVLAIVQHGLSADAVVRLDDGRGGEEAVKTSRGQVTLPNSLCSASLPIRGSKAGELKVWAHRVTAEGDSEPLPVALDLCCGRDERRTALSPESAQVIWPLGSEACELTLRLG